MMTIDFARNVLRPRRRQLVGDRPADAAPGDRPHGRPARRARQGRHACASAPTSPSWPRARRSPRPTATTVVSERHRHRYEFNPRYRRKLEDARAALLGHVARRPARRVHRAARPPVLGRHPGPPRVQEPPEPAGAAVPRVRRRRARPGRGPQPAPPRPRPPSARAVVSVRAASSRADASTAGADHRRRRRRRSRAPDGVDVRARHRPPPRRGVGRAPSTTTAGCRSCASTGPRSTSSCSSSRPASSTSTARPPRRAPRRELAEEVGLRRRTCGAAVRVPQLARLQRRAPPHLPGPGALGGAATTARASRRRR